MTHLWVPVRSVAYFRNAANSVYYGNSENSLPILQAVSKPGPFQRKQTQSMVRFTAETRIQS